MDGNAKFLRIGIFYDGNYFYHVSNYYCYAHPRRARLSIPGIHEFIKKMISEKEHIDERMCQIVDCHYFRGRLPALEANARQILLNERIFDDILMREGVVTHYLPMPHGTEKGVDVSLALETLELSIFKHFDVVALIASDGDYVPLVRKLNSIGTRVMVLAWDFEYMDDNGNLRYTGTSGKLLNEVSYPLMMDQIIDGKIKLSRADVSDLFVNPSAPEKDSRSDRFPEDPEEEPMEELPEELETAAAPGAGPSNMVPADTASSESSAAPLVRGRGKIVQLKNGYGFIEPETGTKNLFFFWEDVKNSDFNSLEQGNAVEYGIGRNSRGECAKDIRLIKP